MTVAWDVAATNEVKLQKIITQKWIAMNGQHGSEGWIEWRRTGYPDFFVPSFTSTQGVGRWPVRLLYPTDELTRNANFPGTKEVYERVWWDIN